MSWDDTFETFASYKQLCLSWGHKPCTTKPSLFSVLLFGVILCILPAKDRRRYICNVVSHWLGAYTKWPQLEYATHKKRSSLIRRGSGGGIGSYFSFLSGSSLIGIGLLVRLWYWCMVFIHRIDKPLLTLAECAQVLYWLGLSIMHMYLGTIHGIWVSRMPWHRDWHLPWM